MPRAHAYEVIMRALTIKQPWAQLIALGVKRIENRTWLPPNWVMGERIAIHAGQAWVPGVHMAPDRADCVHGAIIATATVSRIVASKQAAERTRKGQGRWFVGPFGWVLEDVNQVEPITRTGQLGLWKVGDHERYGL